MSENNRETLQEWLQEAHAFAKHGETMMSGRARAITDTHPELAARLDEHVEETRAHQREIATLLESLGSSLSSAKDIGGRISAVGHSWGTRMTGETVVQTVAATIAFEHYEIANYRALIAAADLLEENQVKATLESLVADDVAMAQWLDEVLVETTRRYLQDGATG